MNEKMVNHKILMVKIDAIVILSSVLVWTIPTAIIWSASTSMAVHPWSGLLFPLLNLPIMYLLYVMARTKRIIPVDPCKNTAALVSMSVFIFMAILRDLVILYGISAFTMLITIIGSVATVYYLGSVLSSFCDINNVG